MPDTLISYVKMYKNRLGKSYQELKEQQENIDTDAKFLLLLEKLTHKMILKKKIVFDPKNKIFEIHEPEKLIKFFEQYR